MSLVPSPVLSWVSSVEMLRKQCQKPRLSYILNFNPPHLCLYFSKPCLATIFDYEMKFCLVKIIISYILNLNLISSNIFFPMIENKVITTMSDCSGKCIIVFPCKFMNQNAADQYSHQSVWQIKNFPRNKFSRVWSRL